MDGTVCPICPSHGTILTSYAARSGSLDTKEKSRAVNPQPNETYPDSSRSLPLPYLLRRLLVATGRPFLVKQGKRVDLRQLLGPRRS